MLALIDYGAGNLRSVMHALDHLGATDIQLVQQGKEFRNVDRIILPGVGAFGAGMDALRKKELVDPIKDAISAGVPYLGICLGMQFLFESSDEMGEHAGLGILPGHVTRFRDVGPLKVPHMGWNQLNVRRHTPLTEDIDIGSYAYFVHSYYCVPDNRDDLAITTNYGGDFASGVQRDNIYGVQFHPEKSQSIGLTLLRNFIEMTEVQQ